VLFLVAVCRLAAPPPHDSVEATVQRWLEDFGPGLTKLKPNLTDMPGRAIP
jgi:hypothetical protein